MGIALGACATFGAPGAVSPDRPGYTDTPGVMPAHAVQLEVGTTFDWTGTLGQIFSTNPGLNTGPTASGYASVGESLVRIGLGGQTELRLFGNSYGITEASAARGPQGLEDAKVGVKRGLRAIPDSVHSWLPNAAVLVATTLPTGASALSAGKAQPEAKLAVNWTTPSPFSLYADFGSSLAYVGSNHATRGWTSVAGWWAVNPKVSLFVEQIVIGRMGGSQSVPVGHNDTDYGVTFLITDRFQVDARAGFGVGSGAQDDRFVGIGLARRW